MNEFKEYTGPFVHSKETYKKIMMSYLIVFIPFLAYALYKNGLQALKIIFIPFIIVLLLELIFSLKDKNFKKIIKENFEIFGILYFPFLLNINTPIYIIIISTVIGYIFHKLIFKKWYSLTILSYLVYIIINIIVCKGQYLEIIPMNPIDYNFLITSNKGFLNLLLNGSELMCPLISILAFIYLYIKKDIKYQITISSLLTIIIITLLIGLINDSVWFPIYFILTGGTIFITTILATDFYSPATKKGKIFYGIFIGITLTILRFISPYNVAPFSIFLANTFSFAFDYLSAFIERKKI